MAHIREILEVEQQRKGMDDVRMIHLFQEGTFYRAYEWSAWLMVRFINEKLKVTHKRLKNTDITFAFIGFPVSSIQKYTAENATFEPTDEKTARMMLPENVFSDADTIETMDSLFQSWKQSLPLAEESSKEDAERKSSSVAAAANTGKTTLSITDIMRQVLSYQLEQHSPLDCMSFLSEIKAQLSEII